MPFWKEHIFILPSKMIFHFQYLNKKV